MPRYRARVVTMLKPEYPDNHAKTIRGGLAAQGFTGISGVRQGRVIELELDGDPNNMQEAVEEMCKQLLAHPVIENFTYEITPILEPEQEPAQPVRTIRSYDLRASALIFGRSDSRDVIRLVSVEWLARWCGILRYEFNGVEKPLGVRMDMDKIAMLDDFPDQDLDALIKRNVRRIWDVVRHGMDEVERQSPGATPS